MNFINKIPLLNLMLFTSCYLSAAPVIENTLGTYTEGQTITVTGSQFGTTDAVTLVWDNVDNLFEKISATDKQIVPSGEAYIWGKNAIDQWADDIVFSIDDPRPGRVASYSGGKRGNFSWPNALKNKNLQNIYVSWWFKPNMPPYQDGKGSGHKFTRIWDNSNGKDTRVSWGAALMHGNGTEVQWKNWGGDAGKWNRMEVWVSGDDGIIKTWVNSKPIYDFNDFTKPPSEHGLTAYRLGWDPSDSSIFPDFKFKMSDIYISSTLARIEISNSSTWDEANSKREVQPITSWSDNKISFTLNSKTLGDMSSGKYLYVVDSNGVANLKGFPLCSSCPQPPEISIE